MEGNGNPPSIGDTERQVRQRVAQIGPPPSIDDDLVQAGQPLDPVRVTQLLAAVFAQTLALMEIVVGLAAEIDRLRAQVAGPGTGES